MDKFGLVFCRTRNRWPLTVAVFDEFSFGEVCHTLRRIMITFKLFYCVRHDSRKQIAYTEGQDYMADNETGKGRVGVAG